MRAGYAWTRTPKWEAAFARRRKLVVPKWKRAWDMRESGMKYWEIASRLGVRIATVFKFVANYEEHRINTQAKRRTA
jgi:transposase